MGSILHPACGEKPAGGVFLYRRQRKMQQKCRYVFFKYGKKRLNCRSFMQNRYIILRKGPNRDKIEPYKIWKIAMQAPCRKSGEIHRKSAKKQGLHRIRTGEYTSHAAAGPCAFARRGIIRRITWGNILEPTAFAAKPV